MDAPGVPDALGVLCLYLLTLTTSECTVYGMYRDDTHYILAKSTIIY